jgi:hypothetical protein
MAVKAYIEGDYAVALDAKAGKIAIRRIARYGNPVADRPTVVFKVGDQAISGSYNLTYLDPIEKITEKNVIFGKDKMYYGANAPRKFMKISEFLWRNADFDLEQIKKDNAVTSMSI